jgi:hypothetical protein
LDAKSHFDGVGSQICYWIMKKGSDQGKVELISNGETFDLATDELCYIPPQFNMIEHNLFMKIMNNTKGSELTVTRGIAGKDYTMTRLGYPKIQEGGDLVLGFDKEYAPFLMSQLGLWLINYISRHDAFIYHNVLTGIKIPDSGFKLSREEKKLINSKEWKNMPSNEKKNVK